MNLSINFTNLRAAFIALFVAIMVVAAPQAALAQDADIDWADAGVASQQTFPSGTTVAGSDGTTATVTRTVTTSGSGTFTPPFATDFLSYFSGQIGSGQSPLLLNFNNSQFDPLDKITVTITLDRAVNNLNFALSDIDNGSYVDAVEVFYDDDLSGGFTNAATNTALWTNGSSVTRTNDATVNGWTGTAPADQFLTDGDIAFDFNNTPVRRIRIVYFSYTGTGDPGSQFAGISDLTYDSAGADLSLTKTLIGPAPVQGGTATWRLTVTSAVTSTETANGVVVTDTLPAGFTFTGASGTGTFDAVSGQWTVGSIAPGTSVSIDITGAVSSAAGTTITNVAEISASSSNDPDSTVNNGVTSEDDYASSSFTVQNGRLAGVPPVLSCPAGQSVFDWDTVTTWAQGSTDNTFAFSTFGDIQFQLANDGVYINNALFGGQSPVVTNVFTGGLIPAENNLSVLADQPNQAGEVETTITLPRSFSGLQFTIFDVDANPGQFADRVQVVGLSGGATVLPTLTNGNSNFVVGNEAFGDAASDSDSSRGNVVVTFAQPVDTVIVRYGNHSAAPIDPGQQGIGIHDITVCDPFTTLSITKTSSVLSDPVNGSDNPKAIPGALIEYLITVANTGNEVTDPDTIVVLDDGPADARICLISAGSGPVVYSEPGGSTGLTYDFATIDSTTDDLEFSNDDGTTFNYTPVADGDGCDTNVTDFRLSPSGAMNGGTSFTLRVRYIVE